MIRIADKVRGIKTITKGGQGFNSINGYYRRIVIDHPGSPVVVKNDQYCF